MSPRMTWDELVRGMVAAGVPKMIAEARANAECGLCAPDAVATLDAVRLPFRLTIPWSLLVSDNDKNEPYIRRSVNGAARPAMRLSDRYKTGKEAIAALARESVGDAEPLAIPLVFVGTVFRPSQHRNDASNFSKICHDALEGIVVQNDGWFFRSTWIKVEKPCIDAPRCEIDISKL